MQDDTKDNISPGIIVRSPGSPRFKHNNNNGSNNSNTGNNKEQDRFLPIANVGRIMKKVLPPNGKISKDAKESVQECVSEFISFVTGEASEKCQREKRKTINGDDIIWSITTLGFEDYVGLLKIYLSKYRDTEGEKINSPKQHNRSEHRPQQQLQQNHYQFQEQEQNSSCNSSMFMSPHPPSALLNTTDQHGFPLAFSPSSIQKQFHQQQDQIDSVGQW